jgi:PilS N terminal
MPHLSEAGSLHTRHAVVAIVGIGARCRQVRQRGISLVEALAFLGVAAVVIFGAISLVTTADDSAGIERARTEIAAIRISIKKLLTPPYGNGSIGEPEALTAQLLNASVFPDTLVIDTTSGAVKNRWGGNVKIFAIPGRFWISYASVPREICMGLVSGASGWYSISVNSGGTWGTVLSFPVPASEAERICASSTNTVEWSST